MSRPPQKSATNPLKHLRTSDVRAAAKLTTQSITAIQRITEGVHQSVLGTLGIPHGKTPGRTGGLTGLVYQSSHGITTMHADRSALPSQRKRCSTTWATSTFRGIRKRPAS